ncbi:MAG: hypothetical protein JSS86_04465 [Cyanobacteria bacterium SZAS LIN-2]|nr:hypothetical protein [Cyanobacteria bacterium SZAS LIN-2]
MFNRLTKIGESFAYLGLGYISYLFVVGRLDLHFSLACTILSALWLALTASQINTLLRTYFDVLSRLKVRIPLTFGLLLSGLAIFAAWPGSSLSSFTSVTSAALPLLAALEICGWLAVYVNYRRTSARYRQQGHGPLPKGAWVNPDWQALQAGDLILTSGRMANRLHETVGHGEIVVEVDGQMKSFSSYMERGTTLSLLKDVTESNLKGGHYIALRLVQPLSPEQKAAMPMLAAIMLGQTGRWMQEAQRKRTSFYKRFHVPAFLQRFVDKKLPITGYDWFGLFTGRLASDHWTCIGTCLDLLHRIGVKTNDYGTGVLGLGTGLLDPIMPVRFLSDRAFRLLTEDDASAYRKRA